MQEVRNAVDQTAREIGTRYDFKGTNSHDRARRPRRSDSTRAARTGSTALRQVLEEKLVRRKVSLKALEYDEGRGGFGGHRAGSS